VQFAQSSGFKYNLHTDFVHVHHSIMNLDKFEDQDHGWAYRVDDDGRWIKANEGYPVDFGERTNEEDEVGLRMEQGDPGDTFPRQEVELVYCF
jgi:hypothetical protein